MTGASDGIGAEYCRQLAKEGMNICLISRTKEKLDKIEAELKGINPKIKTMQICVDFSGNSNVKFYEEQVMEKLK